MIAVRRQIQLFSQAMELKLRKNDFKGGWDMESFRQLLKRLKQEVDELEKELEHKVVRPSDVIAEAADIANFAMMIADNAGSLKED